MRPPRPSRVIARTGSRRSFDAVPWAVCLAADLAAFLATAFLMLGMTVPYPPASRLHPFGPRQAAPQKPRVGRSEFLPVVVEVGEDLAAGAPGGDPAAPAIELGLRVVAVPAPRPVVEAQIGDLAGWPCVGQRTASVVGDHQRSAVLFQQPADRRHEPARVAELEAVAGGRQQLKGGGKGGIVAVEVPRQLPED